MTAGEDPVSNRTDMECLNIGEQDTESSEQEDSRRESIPLIFDHSYTERQSHLHRETKWLGDKGKYLRLTFFTAKKLTMLFLQRKLAYAFV